MPELVFKGKEFVYNHHLTVPYRPLIAHPEKSVGQGSLDDNLIIHGDNLHALKALLPRYAGKVDCIFIDPPYNTGNENWSYNDNVNSPMMREWISSNPVNGEDMLRHDKWCCMMWPRLRLLHELLSERGSLWITLDDNEAYHARSILDEVFGEDGFLATVVWEKADSPRMDADFFSQRHDSMLVYAKDRLSVLFNHPPLDGEADLSHYNKVDADGRKYYTKPLRAMGGQGDTRERRENLYYPIEAPDGTPVLPKLRDGRDGAWRWSQEKLKDDWGRIEWVKTESGWSPYFRIHADTVTTRPPETIFVHSEVGSSRTSKAQLRAIMPGTDFDTPKPIGLLERVLQIATAPESVVLDAFAGSGTTGHAVLAHNADDGGRRRFILVECEEYGQTLTAERVRRAINGYPYTGAVRERLLRRKLTWTEVRRGDKLVAEVNHLKMIQEGKYDEVKVEVKDGVLEVSGITRIEERMPGLGGSFTFCTLGDPIDADAILTGESLPPWEALAALQFHTATGESLPAGSPRGPAGSLEEWYAGEGREYHVWMVYRPDATFLKSREAALTLDLAQRIAKAKPGKRHLVFAPGRFAPNKDLLPLGVEYAPLPFSLYRVEKG